MLAVAVAEALGMTAAEQQVLRYAAPRHDLGKISIPTEILHKPGPLDDAEWDVMRRHTTVGADLLRPDPVLRRSAPARALPPRALGRPRLPGQAGRRRDPRGARASSPSATRTTRWSTDRPYRAAMDPADARAELVRHAGSQVRPRRRCRLPGVRGMTEHAVLDRLAEGDRDRRPGRRPAVRQPGGHGDVRRPERAQRRAPAPSRPPA